MCIQSRLLCAPIRLCQVYKGINVCRRLVYMSEFLSKLSYTEWKIYMWGVCTYIIRTLCLMPKGCLPHQIWNNTAMFRKTSDIFNQHIQRHNDFKVLWWCVTKRYTCIPTFYMTTISTIRIIITYMYSKYSRMWFCCSNWGNESNCAMFNLAHQNQNGNMKCRISNVHIFFLFKLYTDLFCIF